MKRKEKENSSRLSERKEPSWSFDSSLCYCLHLTLHLLRSSRDTERGRAFARVQLHGVVTVSLSNELFSLPSIPLQVRLKSHRRLQEKKNGTPPRPSRRARGVPSISKSSQPTPAPRSSSSSSPLSSLFRLRGGFLASRTRDFFL